MLCRVQCFEFQMRAGEQSALSEKLRERVGRPTSGAGRRDDIVRLLSTGTTPHGYIGTPGGSCG